MSHAVWAGVRLRDVLALAGVEGEAALNLHVEFGGLDEVQRLNKRFRYCNLNCVDHSLFVVNDCLFNRYKCFFIGVDLLLSKNI